MHNRKKPKIYPSEGRCIYCGKGGSEHYLSREHVVPKGLAGSLLFRKASCKSCAVVTAKFEEECLRYNFSVYRTIAKFPSTRPPLQGPRALCLPELPRPGILDGRLPSNDLVCERMLIWSGFTPSEQPFREPSLNFNWTAFLRMLAKIGHGYAVGELGIDSFVHALPQVILGERPDLAQYLVGISDSPYASLPGADPSKHVPSEPIYTAHETYIKILARESDFLVIAGIRLFAPHGAPFYECVAGPLTPKGRARLGLPLLNQSS